MQKQTYQIFESIKKLPSQPKVLPTLLKYLHRGAKNPNLKDEIIKYISFIWFPTEDPDKNFFTLLVWAWKLFFFFFIQNNKIWRMHLKNMDIFGYFSNVWD